MKYKNKFTEPIRSLIYVFICSTVLLLSGCEFNVDPQQIINQIVNQITAQGNPTETALPVIPSPETPETAVPQETSIPEISGPVELELWVPPQFDPAADTPSGIMLRDRIAQFEAENQDIFITVRIKAAAGTTGLLEALTITSNAAPDAMPSLIALSRSDLETAVSRKLVFPIDPYSSVIDGDDWYKYARNLTLIDGASYGLPFVGDALMLLYRPEVIGKAPQSWNDILSRGEPLAFPAADPQSLVPLAIYAAQRADVENPFAGSQIDSTALTTMFQIFIDGSKSGTFPLWVAQFQKDSEAWTSFNELRSNWVITWSSRYLQDLQNDTSAVSLPLVSDMPFTYADGWVWAISDPNVSQHPASAKLAEFLTEADFLKNWSPEAGVFPVRPSSLQGWQNQNVSLLLGQVALSARIKPRNEIISTIGPLIEDQLIQVITGKTTAELASQTVIDKIGNP